MTGTRPDPWAIDRPALGVLELATIARGVVALDRMAKRVETTLVAARTLSSGRYLILLSGEVAEVEEALDAGLAAAAEDLVDHLFLPDPHAALRALLGSSVPGYEPEASLVVVETGTIAAALRGLDRALKAAEVRPVELRLGAGLSGKAVFTLAGALDMAEAAREAIEGALRSAHLIRIEVIARPHPDLPARLMDAERALVRGPLAS